MQHVLVVVEFTFKIAQFESVDKNIMTEKTKEGDRVTCAWSCLAPDDKTAMIRFQNVLAHLVKEPKRALAVEKIGVMPVNEMVIVL